MRTLLVIILFIGGCVTPYYSTSMLADGKTWNITIGDGLGCYQLKSDETCRANLMPQLEKRAKETCGKEPARIFNCGRQQRIEFTCTVKCE